MKKVFFTIAMSLFTLATVSAQVFSCASDLAEQSAKSNYKNYTRDRESSMLFADHYRNSFAARMLNIGCQRTAIKYRVPVVFHVVHLGEPIGTGTNIPDTQINSSLARLNQYWAQFGVEFFPAQQDQYGNQIVNGIDRVDGSGVPHYASLGIDIRTNPTGAPDTTIKKLKMLPWWFCANVWIVNKITTSSAYSNMPSGYEFQGIVIDAGGISARSTLSHEMGHFMGLFHTFNGSSGSNCADNSDPYHMGDYCMDTPPLLQSDCGGFSSCGIFSNIVNSWKNIMGYCAGANLFTPDQKLLVMAALFGEFRWGLVQSAALNPINVPLEVSVDSIAFVQNTALAICNGNLDTKVQFGNFSSNQIDSIKVHFKLGSLDTIFTMRTIGGFLRGSNNWLTMPTVHFTSSGNYNAEVEFLKVNNVDDYNLMNNNQCISVNIVVKTITISVSMNTPSAGSVTGSGNFSCDGVRDSIQVTMNPGHLFQAVKEGNTTVSTSPLFVLPIDLSGGDHTYKVYSTMATFSVAATANPTNGGTVSSMNNVNYGTLVTLPAHTKAGYNFLNWTENGNIISTDSNLSVTVISNRSFVANFEKKRYSILTTVNDSNKGTVTGSGNYGYDTIVTAKANIKTGGKWVNWTENGNAVSSDSIFTFHALGARNLVANFTTASFVISGTVNITGAGTVSGTGTLDYGTTAILHATENSCYAFDGWKEGASFVSTNPTYTFTVTGVRTLTAVFHKKQYAISATVNDAIKGTVTGTNNYDCGEQVRLVATPTAAGKWKHWTNRFGVIVSTDSILVFSASADTSLTANFGAADIATGISNHSSAIDLTIFPNPTSSFLTIKLESMETFNAVIYSIQGSEMWLGNISRQETVNVADYPKGNYILILKLDDGSDSITTKFLVQ